MTQSPPFYFAHHLHKKTRRFGSRLPKRRYFLNLDHRLIPKKVIVSVSNTPLSKTNSFFLNSTSNYEDFCIHRL